MQVLNRRTENNSGEDITREGRKIMRPGTSTSLIHGALDIPGRSSPQPALAALVQIGPRIV